MLALLIVVGAANRASALLRPPDLQPFQQRARPARGGRGAPEGDRARSSGSSRPGSRSTSRRAGRTSCRFTNPLLHYLTDRPNVLRRDVLLQAKPEEQERIVAALRRARPKAIVRWTAPESARPEPNRRGRPSGSRALDEYLDAAYGSGRAASATTTCSSRGDRGDARAGPIATRRPARSRY